MVDDPIVEEVRQARQQHATKFNFDLQAIYQDLKQQEASWNLLEAPFTPKQEPSSLEPLYLKKRVMPCVRRQIGKNGDPFYRVAYKLLNRYTPLE